MWDSYVLTLICAHKFWLVTERTRLQIQALKLGSSTGFKTQEGVREMSLPLNTERSQIRWLRHLARMPTSCLFVGVFWTCPTREDPGHAGRVHVSQLNPVEFPQRSWTEGLWREKSEFLYTGCTKCNPSIRKEMDQFLFFCITVWTQNCLLLYSTF